MIGMSDKLYKILNNLSKQELIELLWNSLDEMQAYNGRSNTACIMLALGWDEVKPGQWRKTKEKKE